MTLCIDILLSVTWQVWVQTHLFRSGSPMWLSYVARQTIADSSSIIKDTENKVVLQNYELQNTLSLKIAVPVLCLHCSPPAQYTLHRYNPQAYT